MALTSFTGPARLIGPVAWKRLHATGMWAIAAVFCDSYFMRIPMDAVYAIPYGILFAAVVLRLLGKQAQAPSRRQARLGTGQGRERSEYITIWRAAGAGEGGVGV